MFYSEFALDHLFMARESCPLALAGRVLAKWLKDVPKPRTRLHALRESAGPCTKAVLSAVSLADWLCGSHQRRDALFPRRCPGSDAGQASGVAAPPALP